MKPNCTRGIFRLEPERDSRPSYCTRNGGDCTTCRLVTIGTGETVTDCGHQPIREPEPDRLEA